MCFTKKQSALGQRESHGEYGDRGAYVLDIEATDLRRLTWDGSVDVSWHKIVGGTSHWTGGESAVIPTELTPVVVDAGRALVDANAIARSLTVIGGGAVVVGQAASAPQARPLLLPRPPPFSPRFRPLS